MLLGTELVEEFVATVILTGRVKGHKPVSAVLIATPECGKTSIVMQRPCKAAFLLTDVTGKGFQELCKMRPEISHFILNDLVAVMSHRQTVNQYTQSIINSMTEEGIMAVAFPGSVEKFDAGHRAIIACTTVDLFKDTRRWWHKIGLSSRMLPFAFDHDKDLTIRIKQKIKNDCMNGNAQQHTSNGKELAIPDAKINVAISKHDVDAIEKISDFRAARLEDPKGYRRLHHYLTLSKAHAIYRGNWKNAVVTKLDIDFINRIDKYVSFTETTPL